MTPVVAVITNPMTRHNRRNPALVPALAYVLGERGEVVSPSDLPALAATADRFRERGVDLVCVNGGDGTVHQVVTAIARAYAGRPLPSFAVLRGGTMNIIADSVGVRLGAEAALGRLVEALHREAPLPSTWRHLIEVDLGAGPPVYGFLSGNGIIARFLEEYYQRSEPVPRDAALLLARAAASALVGGRLAARLTRPFRGEVWVDGAPLPGASWVAVALGSIEQMGLGFRVFPQVGAAPAFQYVALGGTVGDVARELPSLYRGRGVSRPGDRTDLARELVLTSDEPLRLMVDGDFYESPGGRVTYRVGPSVRFVVPE